ncbi:MAG: hypothetical protein A2842_01890 [Candidatus Wildermuthbacteria bacterium RIFCSPHIGHO2_01_FULL_48_25]|uniref:Uncharacterized protein n=1 Tax=Candidatus Wildermuthbacteria bacterium RIFCSPLOWO2_01_FULL_48_16 TaxID=1802461 RepID=A0A1G2RLR4_9BACT|nr:MAG: hypothetical protein A2842_01890 [Candidatus Wildermuthbacteria bacterium RIFCSPHIGHO2_01_FULL_48_25]OHA68564.1 MAG: hypothetical protein A3J57_00225 [Candidatus Wildermuthbacteria bacterium RIFCSPHIGHO2_02_FULL_49_12b]OHA73428.1 MAG: hypothetical protein A3B24_02355 [Candidatus Wildermuthbacteria bacterium RIFCSPLOWO2_01_FULL_48_16]
MRLWPRKLKLHRESRLQRFLSQLEFEMFTVEHDHEGSGGLRPVRDRTGRLLGHVDSTGVCFVYVREDAKKIPAVQHVIDIVRQLNKNGVHIALSDGGKRQEVEAQAG